MAAAQVAGQLIGFAILSLAARRVGPVNMGGWYFSTGIVQIVNATNWLGMSTLGIRQVSQEPASARRVFGEVVGAQLMVSLLVYGVIVVLTPLIFSARPEVVALLPIAALLILVSAITLTWGLIALQAARSVALWGFAGQVVYGALGLFLIGRGLDGARSYAWLNVLGALVAVAGSYAVLARRGLLPRIKFSLRELSTRARASFAFGASIALIEIYTALGTLLLGWLRGSHAVGEYGLALKVPQVLITLTGVWVAALYPHASRLVKTDPARLRNHINAVVVFGALLMLPMVTIAAFTGRDTMVLFFGSAFAGAGKPFAVLVALSAFLFVSLTINNTMLSLGRERTYMRYVAGGAVVSVVVTLLCIPWAGIAGPALGTLSAEVLVGALCLRVVTSTLGPLRFPTATVLRSLPAVAATGLCLVLTHDLQVVARTALALAVYVVLVTVSRAVQPRALLADLRVG